MKLPDFEQIAREHGLSVNSNACTALRKAYDIGLQQAAERLRKRANLYQDITAVALRNEANQNWLGGDRG